VGTPQYIARWDLDKTYLRTDFDTLRDLVRTAIERPDQKRTVPGAAVLMREIGDAGAEVHILSGSPEQLRRRLEAKLRLDCVRWASLTLKPNLQNLLRLRWRALKSQVGYKLPVLLRRRAELGPQRDEGGRLVPEVLLGDDAEADAFVYSLYADVCSGRVDADTLARVMRDARCYDDDVRDAVRFASYLERGEVVARILIHLERQSSPAAFERYGGRVVPFYNYVQAAFVLHEDGRLSAAGALRVAQAMAVRHHFDGGALARSYLDLAHRGLLSGRGAADLARTYGDWVGATRHVGGASELGAMVRELELAAPDLGGPPSRSPAPPLAYLAGAPAR
jgi:hypothetical protein